MSTVPLRIFAGPTCYQHFAQGRRDLYAPDFLLPNAPLTHTWRYGVAPDHGNTVFFHNEASKRSVWVLPVVDRQTLTTRPLAEEEAMRAEGSAPAAKAAAVSASQEQQQQQQSTGRTTRDTTVAHPASSTRTDPGEGDAAEVHVSALSSPSSRASSSAAPRTAAELAPRAEVNAAARDRHSTKREMEEAVTRALAAKVSHRGQQQQQNVNQPSRTSGSETGEGTRLSVHDRLAAYRARKASATSAPASAEAAAKKPEATTTSGQTPAPSQHPPVGATAAKAADPSATDLAVFVKALSAKRSSDVAMAAEAVQREKLVALEEERLAYERQRRRQAEDEAEEEERLRLVRARRIAEQRQLERLRDAQSHGGPSSLNGDGSSSSPAGTVPSHAVNTVNEFLAKQNMALKKASEGDAKARTLEEAIAKALADPPLLENTTTTARGRDKHQGTPVTAAVHSRTGDGLAKSREREHGQISVLQIRPAHREHASVAYGKEFRYMGDITTSGGTPPPLRHTTATADSHALVTKGSPTEPESGLAALLSSSSAAAELPLRDGSGTMRRVVHISQKNGPHARAESLFTGTWKEDHREGTGTLSLPHTLLETHWQDDAVEPGAKALLQTQRLKGALKTTPLTDASSAAVATLASSPSHLTTSGKRKSVGFAGPAMLQLANGARVAGTVTPIPTATTPPPPPHGTEASAATPEGGGNGQRRGMGLGGGPCAIQLPSKDRVEWWPAADAASLGSGKKARASSHAPPHRALQAQARGTGKCRVSFHNGDVYIGSVADYQLHGYGRYEFHETGNAYVGFFYKGFMQGEGSYFFSDGDVYVGDFYQGAFHGVGCYVHRDVYVYEGEWRAGRMHGKGMLAFPNGDTWKGIFDKDKRVSGGYVQFHT